MSASLAEFGVLVQRIYGAALGADDWSQVVRESLGFVGSSRGVLGIESADHLGLQVGLSWEIDPELLARWSGEEFNGFDPVHERVGVPPPGTVFRNWSVVPRDEIHAMDVYRACYGPIGADDHLVAILTSSAERGSYFTAFRGEGEPSFSADDETRMRILAPHLAQAARISQTMARLDRVRVTALDVLPYGIAMLGAHGVVSEVNRECQAIVAANDGIALRRGRLVSHEQRLETTIRDATWTALGRGVAGGAIFSISRPSLKRPYQVLVAPVPLQRQSRGVLLFGEGDACLVVIRDPEAVPLPQPEALQQLFGLTPALSRLASALAAGKMVVEYAAETGVTEGTVRQQLKELFARTGTSRQADLVRVMLSSVSALHRRERS